MQLVLGSAVGLTLAAVGDTDGTGVDDALSVYDGISVGVDEGVLVCGVDGMNGGGDVVGDAVGAWVCSRTDACSYG